MDASAVGGPRELCERAHAALRAAGGDLPAMSLAATVFGASRGHHWLPILRGILVDDPRFEETADGWRLARVARGTAADGFVAIAIGATGPDPARHRVVRISAVRTEPGRKPSQFDAVLNPRRRIAAYLRDAMRTSDAELDDAPGFADVAPNLAEFLGSSPLVGMGIRWIVAMLNAELARADLCGIANPLVELDDEAANMTLAVEKRTLATIAHRLGFEHPRPNFPPADAAVTARIARTLLDSDGRARTELGPAHRDPLEPRPRSAWLRSEPPECPGVYLVVDESEAVLYVGKARNLRRRLAAYRGRAPGLDRQLGGLVDRGADVKFVETGSDLEARLLEASLIRQHRPAFNVQRRTRPSMLFIRVAPWDTVRPIGLARSPTADGATYLGPFGSQQAARAQLALVRQLWPAATQRRPVCAGDAREAVFAALRLLSGQRFAALAAARAKMRDAASAGDSAGLTRMRAVIRHLLDPQPRPSPLIGTAPGESLLVIEPARLDGTRRAHLIRECTLAASGDVTVGADPGTVDPAELIALLTPRDPSQAHEEDAEIVLRWLGSVGADHHLLRIRIRAED